MGPATPVKPSASRSAPQGTADLSIGTTVRRGLSNDEIRGVVTDSMGQVRACYERSLKADPSLRGRLLVSWRISAEGEVSGARVKETDAKLNDDGLHACVTEAISGWTFPDSARSTTVTFPFTLLPG